MSPFPVIAGLRRSKDDVASLAYAPAIPKDSVLKTEMRGSSPRMTGQ